MAYVKKIEKYRCETCYDKKYKINLDSNGIIITDICNECVPKLNLSEEIIISSKGKCKIINEQKLNPDQTTYFKSYIKEFSKLKDNEIIVNAINSFIKERYQNQKKENKRLEILKNITELKIVRQIDPSQFVAFHLFTRNQVFQIISDPHRAKKTIIDEQGKILDIPEVRSFVGWGGNLHFIISGPALCDYDQSVFDALVKLWHEKQVNGIIFETNLSEIWRTMGNKSVLGEKNRLSLKRSFSRLHKVSIEVSSVDKKNKNFWGGGIVDNIIYNENPKSRSDNKVTVHLNLYMASNYLQGSYATISHTTYLNLSAYAKKIYLYLMSHDHRERKVGLDKLRTLIGVSADILEKSFYIKLNNSIKELKEKNILEASSKIERNIFISYVTKEAWDMRPVNPEPLEITETIL